MPAALSNGHVVESARARILSNSAARPPRLEILAENIPADLKLLDRWVLWRWTWKPRRDGSGKWDKPPINARTGGGASTTDPLTWSSFETTYAAYRAGRGDGIGIVLGELPDGRTLSGVDVDDSVDPESGDVSDMALAVAELLGSYAETSPSGTGIKVLCYGALPPGGRERGHCECYDSGRYFTVTGRRLTGSPYEVRDAAAELAQFHSAFIAPPRNTTTQSDRDLAIEALGGLCPSRADGYRSWILVGMALFATDPSLLEEWNQWSRQSDKYAPGECEKKWQTFSPSGIGLGSLIYWAREDGWSPPTGRLRAASPGSSAPRMRTDMGNAERFAALHGADVRYIHAWDKWLVWNGKYWQLDDSGEVVRRAKQTAKSIFGEAAQVEDRDEIDEIIKWAKISQSSTRIDAMLKLARSERPIPVGHEQLDAHPWLLNCENGTIDLKSGALRRHDRSDLLTKSTGVDYPDEPGIEAPQWLDFLGTIFDQDVELVGFMQRLMGAALVGLQLEHIAPIAYGSGANGKSVFTSVVQSALGEYAMTAPPGLLMTKRSEQHPTELADLFGKRLVVISETKDGQRLDEGLVKSVTGGDKIRARRMREDHWEFNPSHLPLVVTNHKPIVRGTDYGIWRRLRLIPFTVTIPPERQDRHLAEKLKAELPAILRWMVDGCLQWQRHGLGEPPCVMAATEQYKTESDTFLLWFNEVIDVDPMSELKASRVYRSYKAWCDETGELALSQTQFGSRIGERILGKRLSNGTLYRGIRFRSSCHEEDVSG